MCKAGDVAVGRGCVACAHAYACKWGLAASLSDVDLYLVTATKLLGSKRTGRMTREIGHVRALPSRSAVRFSALPSPPPRGRRREPEAGARRTRWRAGGAGPPMHAVTESLQVPTRCRYGRSCVHPTWPGQ
uniref:Uncharacterized protein n=1 Tax=Setaria viridis TaxID=4556 RepID=A0A4U6UMT8_SETVI|nr:hypothetical protein SEVIR_5G328850v2 [Setaria viridis]